MSDLDAGTSAWLVEQLQEALRAARQAGAMAGNVARIATDLETRLDPGPLDPSMASSVTSVTAVAPAPPTDRDGLERLVGLLNRAADVVIVLDADANVVYVERSRRAKPRVRRARRSSEPPGSRSCIPTTSR